MTNFFLLYLLESILTGSLITGSVLQEAKGDQTPAIILRIQNKVSMNSNSQTCSIPVTQQAFHLRLNVGNNNIRSDNVATDPNGYFSVIFSLPHQYLLADISSIELCDGSNGGVADTSCTVVPVKNSDIESYRVARGQSQQDLTTGVLRVQWCIGSDSSTIIPGGSASGQDTVAIKSGLGSPEGHADALEKTRVKRSVRSLVKDRQRRGATQDASKPYGSRFRQSFGGNWKRNIDMDEAKRMWGDSGEAWLKRNDDKRMWGDSGEAWLKRNDDKRMWGDSGEAWLKRNRFMLPPEVQGSPEDSGYKRAWGDDGMAWV